MSNDCSTENNTNTLFACSTDFAVTHACATLLPRDSHKRMQELFDRAADSGLLHRRIACVARNANFPLGFVHLIDLPAPAAEGLMASALALHRQHPLYWIHTHSSRVEWLRVAYSAERVGLLDGLVLHAMQLQDQRALGLTTVSMFSYP